MAVRGVRYGCREGLAKLVGVAFQTISRVDVVGAGIVTYLSIGCTEFPETEPLRETLTEGVGNKPCSVDRGIEIAIGTMSIGIDE